jgi:hypothetical protein
MVDEGRRWNHQGTKSTKSEKGCNFSMFPAFLVPWMLRGNPVVTSFYDRLLARGKCKGRAGDAGGHVAGLDGYSVDSSPGLRSSLAGASCRAVLKTGILAGCPLCQSLYGLKEAR